MRVLIAMSGGVDSAVAAHLLQAAGHELVGCTLLLTEDEGAAAEAKRTAAALGFPHRTLDLRTLFCEEVMRPFAEEYARGRTPNPCVRCNQKIKLGALLHFARREGFDRLATGHYARIRQRDGHPTLCKARDGHKDQSYFLYTLGEDALSYLLFPLGELTKDEVRAIARERGLPSASARDSQDICFAPRGHHAALVEELVGVPPFGSFVDAEGRVLGTHSGLHRYTLGQHKGLALSLGRVRYVTAIDPLRNTVTLGDEEELYRSEVSLCHLHLVSGEWDGTPLRAAVRLRSRAKEAPVTVYPLPGGGARLVFDSPERAPTPGQSAVLYDGERVLGGGVI